MRLKFNNSTCFCSCPVNFEFVYALFSEWGSMYEKSTYGNYVSAWFSVGGRWRIRTADPLLVRQTLWTSWAKRPNAFAMGRERFLSLSASLVRCLKVAPSLSREVFPLKSDAKVESFFELCKCFAKKFHFFLKKGRKTLRFYLDSYWKSVAFLFGFFKKRQGKGGKCNAGGCFFEFVWIILMLCE